MLIVLRVSVQRHVGISKMWNRLRMLRRMINWYILTHFLKCLLGNLSQCFEFDDFLLDLWISIRIIPNRSTFFACFIHIFVDLFISNSLLLTINNFFCMENDDSSMDTWTLVSVFAFQLYTTWEQVFNRLTHVCCKIFAR